MVPSSDNNQVVIALEDWNVTKSRHALLHMQLQLCEMSVKDSSHVIYTQNQVCTEEALAHYLTRSICLYLIHVWDIQTYKGILKW